MIRDSGRVEAKYRSGRLVWRELTPTLINLLGEEWFETFLEEEEDIILDGRRLALRPEKGGVEDVLEEEIEG